MIETLGKFLFRPKLSIYQRYLGALGMLVLGFLLHISLGQTGIDRPFVTYFLLMPITAVLFGFGPGVLMLIGSVLLGQFVQPYVLSEPVMRIRKPEIMLALVYLLELTVLLFYIKKIVKLREEQQKAEIESFQEIISANDAFLKLFQLAIDLANDVFIIGKAERGSKVIYANQAFFRATGYEQDEIVGNSIELMWGPQTDANTIRLVKNATARGTSLRVDILSYKKNGREFWSELDISPVIASPDSENHWIAVIRNIQDRKEYEMDLKKNSKAAKEESAARVLLIAKIAHEIRTPMTGVLGLTELAINQDTQSPVKDSLSSIRSASLDLIKVLDSVLDFARLDSKKIVLELAPFRCIDVSDKVYALYHATATLRGLQFECIVDSNINFITLGDAFRIHQVLTNLVSNALKFTQLGYIRVSISLLKADSKNALVRFSVADSGIGISEQARLMILNPYMQADNTLARVYGGTGLGLAICQQLLKLMDSEIETKSSEGHGSEFSFNLVLPICEMTLFDSLEWDEKNSTLQAGELLQHKSQTLTGKTILIAEDNLINQKVISEFLKLAGAQTIVVSNGIEAIARLAEQHFDLILMDIQMPKMDGFEATQKIRAQFEFKSIPIIGLSAGVSPKETEACVAAGIDDFIPKPIDPDLLVSRVIHHLNKQ